MIRRPRAGNLDERAVIAGFRETGEIPADASREVRLANSYWAKAQGGWRGKLRQKALRLEAFK